RFGREEPRCVSAYLLGLQQKPMSTEAWKQSFVPPAAVTIDTATMITGARSVGGHVNSRRSGERRDDVERFRHPPEPHFAGKCVLQATAAALGELILPAHRDRAKHVPQQSGVDEQQNGG